VERGLVLEGAYVYLLECSDGTLYCGSSRKEIEERLSEHNNGLFTKSYTYQRRPVKLIWCEKFTNITDAIDCERRLKGWSKAKKLAMIRNDWNEVSRLAIAHENLNPVKSTSTLRQAQGEVEDRTRARELKLNKTNEHEA
jgi:putative endonuclease